MTDVTVKRIDEMDSLGGVFARARAELGVSSFGLGVHDFPPNQTGHPNHNHLTMPEEMAHANDGQEEVYVVLSGEVTLVADGEEHVLEPGTIARVGPGQTRQLVTHERPARVLAIGGIPGKRYTAPAWSEVGAVYG